METESNLDIVYANMMFVLKMVPFIWEEQTKQNLEIVILLVQVRLWFSLFTWRCYSNIKYRRQARGGGKPSYMFVWVRIEGGCVCAN